MLNTPPVKIKYCSLHNFLYHIIDMPYSDCFRRPFSIPSKAHEAMLLRHSLFENKVYPVYRKFKNMIQRVKTGTLLISNRKL